MCSVYGGFSPPHPEAVLSIRNPRTRRTVDTGTNIPGYSVKTMYHCTCHLQRHWPSVLRSVCPPFNLRMGKKIRFPKWCRHFWTQGETQGPEIYNAVTYHRQEPFVFWFGIHHCAWRYTRSNLLDISDICSGFKPFELFLFLCFSRSVQNVVFL